MGFPGILIGIVAEADLATKLTPQAALPLLKRVKAQAADPYVHPSSDDVRPDAATGKSGAAVGPVH